MHAPNFSALGILSSFLSVLLLLSADSNYHPYKLTLSFLPFFYYFSCGFCLSLLARFCP